MRDPRSALAKQPAALAVYVDHSGHPCVSVFIFSIFLIFLMTLALPVCSPAALGASAAVRSMI
jgi:hypothetical protein